MTSGTNKIEHTNLLIARKAKWKMKLFLALVKDQGHLNRDVLFDKFSQNNQTTFYPSHFILFLDFCQMLENLILLTFYSISGHHVDFM